MGMETEHKFCIIVGGGMCGIAVAAFLVKKKVVPYEDFRLLDKLDDYGGVWQANHYPGAACDVVSHCYSMKFHLNPKWSRKYAPREEIQEYYVEMARYYGLPQSTSFNTSVISATWDEKELMWRVLTEDVKTGTQKMWTCRVLISAAGQFSRPKYANIPGAKDFKGEVWHTSQWRHDYDLTGKRVAMIGTGPSTAQVAPKIQPIVKQLTLFQRSPTYVFPRRDEPIDPRLIWLFTWFPPLLLFYHLYLYYQKEKSRPNQYSGTPEQAVAAKVALAHLHRQVKDPVLRAKLTPNHEFGCKRPLVLDDYYPTLEKPNVELITNKPVRITADSIISDPPSLLPKEVLEKEPDGAYDVPPVADDHKEVETKIDVLIWGTGFEMRDQGGNFQVCGIDGVNLHELWGEKPEAYYGLLVSQFPNFLIMFGPNAGAPWANLTTVFEVQANYVARMVRHIKRESSRRDKAPYAMMVEPGVQKRFNEWIQANMGPLAIISPNCSNYYTSSTGHISFNWPFSGYYYRYCLWRIRTEDFVEIRGKPGSAMIGNSSKDKATNGHVSSLKDRIQID